MSETKSKDQKCPVALANGLDGIPTIIIGIPEAAYAYCRDGSTHNFDLEKVGIPMRIMLFGGPDYDDVIATMSKAAEMLTGQLMTGSSKPDDLRDLGIDPPVKH